MSSISDFTLDTGDKNEKPTEWVAKEPEAPKEVSPTLLVTPDVQGKPALPAAQPNGLIITGGSTVVTPPALTQPVQSAEEILNGIMGRIGDKIGVSSNLKMLIHGDPGSMKSSFGATAPNNLVADLEDGLMAAKFSPHGVAPNVRPYPWVSFEDFDMLCKALAADVEPLKNVEVFTVDTFSEVHKRGLAEVTEREWRKRPSTNRYVPETEHHQENNERMLRIIRSLKDMNRNLIILTHSTTVEPKGKQAKTYPDFSEKLANKIEAMMDIVAYAEKRIVDGNLVMVMTFRSGEGVHCKTRIPLPNEMINPTYADIVKVWEESKNV